MQSVSDLDRLAQGEVARKHDVLTLESDDERSLHGPLADPRDHGERRDDLVVRKGAQLLRENAARTRPARSRSVSTFLQERPAPRSAAGSAPASSGQGRRPSNIGLDARDRSASRRDRQLLTDNLKEERSEQIHRR